MTRPQYVQLLNLAIERGEGPTFREHFPTPDSCPQDLYDHLFPAVAPVVAEGVVLDMTAEPEKESN